MGEAVNEIICPHCSKAFKIDEAGYADILKQVRDSDFEHQLHERLELAERDKQSAVELARAQLTAELQKQGAEREAELEKLKAQLEAGEVARKLAVAEALNDVEKQRDDLVSRPLKKWASNASGTLFSKKRVAQTRLRSDCTGQSGLFAGHLAHFGRTYPRAHA